MIRIMKEVFSKNISESSVILRVGRFSVFLTVFNLNKSIMR
jgi:hypothetical protein